MQLTIQRSQTPRRAAQALLCSGIMLGAAVAHAGAIHPTKNTSLCLDVAGGSTANGAKVQVANCYGNAAQNWTWVNGSLQVMGKCLDVSGANTSAGTTLEIWDCNGSSAQKFGVSGSSLVWTGGNLCTDVPNNNVTDGQTVRTWSCNQSQAQSFQGLGASTTGAGASFTSAVHPAGNAALCLDVAGGSSANGAKVQIATCYGASDTAQTWNYTGGALKVFGNKCLDVNGGNTSPGINLQIWDCNGSNAQRWVQNGGAFVWTGGNLCIDVPNNNATDGQLVRTWTCNQSTAQTFSTTAGTGGATATGSAPSSSSNGWNLVWSDEFNGASLDRSKWNVEVSCDGGGNNEWQCYVDSPANISVANGMLSINTIKQNYNGKSYTSGRINTSGKAHWTYGRFEARVNSPCGQGFWPAAWMLPEPNSYGTWPTSGELDIMEVLGGNGSQLFGTAHFGTPWPNQKQLGGQTTPAGGGNFCGSFHIYALEWTNNQATWSVDGFNYFTLKNTDGNWSPLTHWPFDQNYFFILNSAMGGDWPGAPDASIQSGTMQVDYVRAYSR